jgi:hypothetical protein
MKTNLVVHAIISWNLQSKLILFMPMARLALKFKECSKIIGILEWSCINKSHSLIITIGTWWVTWLYNLYNGGCNECNLDEITIFFCFIFVELDHIIWWALLIFLIKTNSLDIACEECTIYNIWFMGVFMQYLVYVYL